MNSTTWECNLVALPSILLHIPHSSRVIPNEERGRFLLSDRDLELEMTLMTDSWTEDLFQLEGAHRLVFPVSRLLVDPERFRNDADEPMAIRGMGAVYTKTSDGRTLKCDKNREGLLRRYYDPHHSFLEQWSSDRLREDGRCLIIDCHSFPDVPLPCDLDQSIPRPDACVGSDEFHTSPRLRMATLEALSNANWSVGDNWPYSGSLVPASRYQSDPRVQSVMIEINRRLYQDYSAQKLEGYIQVRKKLMQVLQVIAEFENEG